MQPIKHLRDWTMQMYYLKEVEWEKIYIFFFTSCTGLYDVLTPLLWTLETEFFLQCYKVCGSDEWLIKHQTGA